MPFSISKTVTFAFLVVLSRGAFAQSQEPDPDIEDGKERTLKGDYEVAEKKFTKAVENAADPKLKQAALALRAQALMLQFKVKDAVADAKELLLSDAKNPAALLILSEAAAREGNYEEAIDHAKKGYGGALDRTFKMRVSNYYDQMGDFDAGSAEAKKADLGDGESPPDNLTEIFALGRALERMKSYEDASQCYLMIEKKEGRDLDNLLVRQDAIVARGNLYQKVYGNVAGRSNGEKEYNEVLKANKFHFGANVARYKLGRSNPAINDAASQFPMGPCFDRALDLDPASAELCILKVESLTPDRRFEESRKELQPLLTKNPRYYEALVERAALDYLQGKKEDYEKFREQDHKIRPNVSSLERAVGTYLKDLYRFADAIPVLEEAVKRDASDGAALTALGECYAHGGKEDLALATLQKAEDAQQGFVHPWRNNMIEVLKVVKEKYLTVRSPNFTFKMHPLCEPVLAEMLPPFYEYTRKDYGERFGYLPKDPVQVEVFNRFGDFSVRSVGFTGFGALGVCFGSLITAVSPLAQEFRGKFSYLDTAWHEYAHVVHLALSKGRVPRWFTEGLATLEEKKRNPSFDRHMEFELLDARATGNIYPIMELNSAFRGPRIIFGYYQGGLICEFLEKKTSADRFVDALKLFGDDVPLDAVIQKAFGMTVEELDKGFLQFVDEKLKSVKVRSALDAKTIGKLRGRVAKNPKDVESIRALAWAYMKRGAVADADVYISKLRAINDNDPEGYLIRAELSLSRKANDVALTNFKKGFDGGAEEFAARMNYANLLSKQKEKDMELIKQQLRAAIAAFPEYSQETNNPRILLATFLAGEEKMDESTALLEEVCKISGTATDTRLELSKRYEAKGDFTNRARVLGEILDVDPFQRSIQKQLAESLIQIKKYEEAARAARLAGKIDPGREPQKPRKPGEPPPPEPDPEVDAKDRADCFALEAEAWFWAKQLDQAKASLQKSLKLDAACERALDLQQKMTAPLKDNK